MHFEDGLRRVGAPRIDALQQLHAAERQRDRARVAGHVLVGSARAACRARLRPTGPAPTTARLSVAFVFGITPPGDGRRHRWSYYSAHPGVGVTSEGIAMGLMDFIKKQFIDILEWTETGDGTLAWRYPMADNEIQYGGSLTVRESQIAVFVNEGKIADVFGPGRYTLTTNTLPVLTYLKNWDKLFQSPFKSDVYFFSTRQQVDQRWA